MANRSSSSSSYYSVLFCSKNTLTSSTGVVRGSASNDTQENGEFYLALIDSKKTYNFYSSDVKMYATAVSLSNLPRVNEPKVNIANIYYDEKMGKEVLQYEIENFTEISEVLSNSLGENYTLYADIISNDYSKCMTKCGADGSGVLMFDKTYLSTGKFVLYGIKSGHTTSYGNRATDFKSYALSSENLPSKNNFGKEYWGTWIQMDTGTTYYCNNVMMYNVSSKSVIATNPSSFTFDNENIIKNTKGEYFFRKGGSTRSFKASVSGFEGSVNAFRRSIEMNDLSVTRTNENNPSDTEDVTLNDLGEIEFTDAVAGDSQKVKVSSSENIVDMSMDFIPRFDGDMMGTIPIIEKNKYGFKTSYTINSDDQDFCYAGKVYDLSITLRNIGDVVCAAGVVTFESEDPNFKFGDSSSDMTIGRQGNYSTIESNAGVKYTFKARYDTGVITTDYKDVVIKIKVTDSRTQNVWNDKVVLRFYRGQVKVNIAYKAFSSSNRPSLNGFFIYPDGRSKRFSYETSSSSVVKKELYIPWSSNNTYYLVFSGAYNTSDEIAYGFNLGKTTTVNTDVSGTYTISDINAYETNDAYEAAVDVTGKSVKAYLSVGDIDYYKLNVSNTDIYVYNNNNNYVTLEQ